MLITPIVVLYDYLSFIFSSLSCILTIVCLVDESSFASFSTSAFNFFLLSSSFSQLEHLGVLPAQAEVITVFFGLVRPGLFLSISWSKLELLSLSGWLDDETGGDADDVDGKEGVEEVKWAESM